MAQLTEWLKLMVAEINRKREDEERAKQEEAARKQEEPSAPQPEKQSHRSLRTA